MCKVKNYLLELSALSRLPAPGQTALPFQENIFHLKVLKAAAARGITVLEKPFFEHALIVARHVSQAKLCVHRTSRPAGPAINNGSAPSFASGHHGSC